MLRHIRNLDAVVDHYLDRRRPGAVLSAREAVTALRALMPDSPLTDVALANLFAAAAIRRGRDVAFDMREDPHRPVT